MACFRVGTDSRRLGSDVPSTVVRFLNDRDLLLAISSFRHLDLSRSMLESNN